MYTSLPTGTGSPQQHVPITVTLLPNPPCQLSLWEETGVPGEKTMAFGRALTFLFSCENWVQDALRMFSLRLEPAALEVSVLTASPPKPHKLKIICMHSEI
jgi:hypothetical protein